MRVQQKTPWQRWDLRALVVWEHKKHHLQCSGKWYTNTHTQARTRTHPPQSVQENNEYKIIWDFNVQTVKVIDSRLPDTVCINKQKRVSDYRLCNSWEPKYSYQITEKNWQVPGLNNRITESLECQGSGHTGSYICSQREQVMSKKIYQYIKQIGIPADIISI